MSSFILEFHIFVDQNLAIIGQNDTCPLQRPWRRPFEIYPGRVEPATVTRALELLLVAEPVWSTTQVRAYRYQSKYSFGIFYDPDAELVLPALIHTDFVFFRETDLERLRWLEKHIRKKKSAESGQSY